MMKPIGVRVVVPTAVRKSFRLLEAVGAAGGPVSNQVLAEEAGLTRSTLSRLVLSLEALGYLSRAQAGVGWELGPAAFRLGLSGLSSLDIRAVALPLMRRLSEEIDLPVDLATPLGVEMVYFELVQKAGQAVLATGIGARLPVITTALGHAALFAMEESVRKDILRKIRRATKHDWSRLEEALSRSFRQLEQHGFCLVSGMLRPEVTAIGAPLVDPRSRNIFSFSCTVIGHPPAQSLFEDEIGPKLLATVQRVATSLGAR